MLIALDHHMKYRWFKYCLVNNWILKCGQSFREENPLFWHRSYILIFRLPETLRSGSCPHHSTETPLLKDTNHFQVAWSPVTCLFFLYFTSQNNSTSLTLPPSWNSYCLPFPDTTFSLFFLPTQGLLLSHCCWFLTLIPPLNVYHPKLCFQTPFPSLSTHSLWWSHPVTWLPNHLSARDNQIDFHLNSNLVSPYGIPT